jgi:hypothetical protein
MFNRRLPRILLAVKSHSAASGFALGRNQKVRFVEKLRKVLQLKRLRPAKIKIAHKKQGVDR